jgi:hypothetical protein
MSSNWLFIIAVVEFSNIVRRNFKQNRNANHQLKWLFRALVESLYSDCFPKQGLCDLQAMCLW